MNETKKAPTAEATATGARQRDGGNHLTHDFTTPHAGRQAVTAYLGHGKENALTAAELAGLMGVSDPRIVTKQVEKARKMGDPICASCSGEMGYYIASNERELAAYLRSLDRRLKHTHATRRALGDALARLSGQSEIEGW